MPSPAPVLPEEELSLPPPPPLAAAAIPPTSPIVKTVPPILDQFIDDKNTKHLINEIEEDLIDAFIKSTKNTSLLQDFSEKGIKIVYTPLNGAGYKIVPQVLKECGFKNLLIVEEQKNPDGNFPTCPKPNPELKEAMELGIKLAKSSNSDLLIATDPDSDRCGIGVRYKDEFLLLNGNEVAILMLNYLTKVKSDLKGKEIVRSIVSTSFVDKIANDYGIKGNIGSQIPPGYQGRAAESGKAVRLGIGMALTYLL